MFESKYLGLLAKEYPSIEKATAEIINLRAILSLPKGTEYFLSDLHGEHEAFIHMVKSASGIIRSKIDETFGRRLTETERERLGALIYDAESELERAKKRESDYEEWCKVAIYRLIEVCKSVSTKYTRSKVRKHLPKDSAYILDELLHADDEANRAHYYSEIINSMIEFDAAETFIVGLSDTISRLAVDKLHIIGDIFDRGPHPDYIMEYLMDFHDVDFQWGNHDIVWMGAATGNWACITNVIRMNISYNNFDMLEIGYGINLRPLAVFAAKTYGSDPCAKFMPHVLDKNTFDPVDENLAAKMHKAIAIIQHKVEGQRIKSHPEYSMQHRLLLDKMDLKAGTVTVRGEIYPLLDTNFPTVNPESPYELSEEENALMNTLEASFLESEKLQKHVRFLYNNGAMYKCVNGNLMYHGCIPMTADGEFEKVSVNGKTLSGKAYMDYLDAEVRKAYFNPLAAEETGRAGDIMWYLWLGAKSPLFGKDQMTTFERSFIADKKTHKEYTVPYYKLINEKKNCEKILAEFELDPKSSHILNGHMPVKIKDGESPIKGDGKLFIIDGGISKAYQKQTGIAGYTFIYNSRFMALAEHKKYTPKQEDGSQEFHAPTIRIVENLPVRQTVKMSDGGAELEAQVEDLKKLVRAYKTGQIKERK